MKLFLFVILFLILIKEINSKKCLRKYILIRDEKLDENGLSQFSILNSNEKEYLYRLKTSYKPYDEIMIISYPSEEIVGYLQGQWKFDQVNVTFEIFDLKTNEWTNGTIEKDFNLFIEKDFIQWNNQTFILKKKLFSMTWKYFNSNDDQLAQFRMRFRWFNWSLLKYDLKIFVDIIPDFILFFSLILQDHRSIIF